MVLDYLNKLPDVSREKIKKISLGQSAFFNTLDWKFWSGSIYVVLYCLLWKSWAKSFNTFFNYYFRASKFIKPGLSDGLKVILAPIGLFLGLLGFMIALPIVAYKVYQGIQAGIEAYNKKEEFIGQSIPSDIGSPSPPFNNTHLYPTLPNVHSEFSYYNSQDRPPPYNPSMEKNRGQQF